MQSSNGPGKRFRRVWLSLLGISLALPARAGSRELPSAFFISKSENRNEVHFAVSIDERCVPVGAAPVRPYWLDREKGVGVTSPLLPREEPAYGIASQTVVSREATRGTIRLSLRALPQRSLEILTARAVDGTCQAWTHTAIAGERAQLFNVHATLKFLGIESILLTGWATSDKRVIRETIKP